MKMKLLLRNSPFFLEDYTTMTIYGKSIDKKEYV